MTDTPRRPPLPTRPGTLSIKPRAAGAAPAGKPTGPKRGKASMPEQANAANPRSGRGFEDRPRRDAQDGDRPRKPWGERTDRAERGERSDRPFERREGGDRPRQDRSWGDKPYGDRPRRDAQDGDRPRKPWGERTDRAERGERSDRPFERREGSDRPRQDRPWGDKPYGDRPRRDAQDGDRPRKPWGERTDRAERGERSDRPFERREGSDRPRQDRPWGDKPYGDRPRRDAQDGDRPRKPWGERTDRAERGERSDRPFERREGSDRPRQDRPWGDKPYGDRPRRDAQDGDRPRKPWGERTDRAERGERSDRPFERREGSDRPRQDRPWGDKPYGDRPRRDAQDGERAERPRREGGWSDRGEQRDLRPRSSFQNHPAPTPQHEDDDSAARAPRHERKQWTGVARVTLPTQDHPEGSVRLSKRMAELGLCSRREADEYIEQGWVRVDGKVVKELGSRVMPDQQVELDRRGQVAQEKRVTILLHKPVGYVSGQAEDGYQPASVLITEENRWSEDKTPIQFQNSHHRGLAPAGRLDIDSVGLLVFTQDGRIARALIGDDSNIEKEYHVRVEGHLSEEGLALLNHGLSLDGEALRPAKVSWQNEDQLRFVLREGKKRQIRRMCELVGLKVVGLKRIRIGKIPLGNLPAGQWRYLNAFEEF